MRSRRKLPGLSLQVMTEELMCWRRKWRRTPVFLLRKPLDRGVWWATAHGAQRRTQPKPLSPAQPHSWYRNFLPVVWQITTNSSLKQHTFMTVSHISDGEQSEISECAILLETPGGETFPAFPASRFAYFLTHCHISLTSTSADVSPLQVLCPNVSSGDITKSYKLYASCIRFDSADLQ